MLNKKIFKFQTLSKIFVSILLISLVGLGTFILPLREKVKAYDPETSGDITITITEVTPAHQTQIGKSATNVALMKIVVENTSSTVTYTWTDLTVTYTGTRDSDIATAGVNLHLNGTSTGDIKFERTLSASQATFAMSGSDAEIGPSASKTYYISLDTAAAPTHGDTLGFRINAGDMTFYCASPVVTISDLPGGTRNSETATIDSQVPTILSAETGDQDGNGAIDNYKLTFSETIDVSELTADNANGFAVAGGSYINEKVCFDAAGSDCDPDGNSDGTILYVVFDESSADTDAVPELTYNGSTVKDIASPANSLAEVVTGTVTEVDKARPILLSVANYDVDTADDGKNDEIYLTFSEPITDSSVDVGDIKIDGNADGSYETDGTLEATSSVNHGQTDEANDKYLTIKSTALTGTAKVGIQVQASAITDAATSPNDSGAAQAIAHDAGSGNTDKSKPVILTAATGDQDGNGLIDNYKLTFSESIEGTTLTVGGANGFAITNFGAAGGTGEQLDAAANGTNISTSSDYTILYLTFSEDTGDDRYTNGGTAVKPTIAYTDDNISGVTDEAGVIKLATFTAGNGAPFDEADAAVPVVLLTNAATKSNPNASADQYTLNLTIKYSEDISASTASTSEFTVLNTADAEVTISSASESTDTLTLVLAQSSPNNTDQMSVAYSGTSIVDAVALAAANFNDTAITDAVEPVVLTQKYKDDSADKSVDRLELIFSEIVDWNGNDLDQVAVTANNLTSFAGDATAVAGTGTNTLTLTIAATTNLTGVNEGQTEPTYVYTATTSAANRIRDNASTPNDLSNITATTIADAAVPIKKTMEMKDANSNGKIDKVEITYTEDLATTTATSSWTLANVPGSGTLASVAESGGVITLTITEGSANTAVGSFTVALDNSGSEVKDLANNNAGDITAIAPDDKAGPAITAAETTDGTTITITLSESIDRTQATSSDFTVTDDGEDDLGVTTITAVQDTGSGSTITATITGSIQAGLDGTSTVKFSGAGVILDGDSNSNTQTGTVAITDAIAPTISSMSITDSTHVDVVFTEKVNFVTNSNNTATAGELGQVLVASIPATAASVDDATKKITFTFGSSIGTVTRSDFNLAAILEDESSAKNAFAAVTNETLADGCKPEFVKAEAVSNTSIEITFTEDVTVKGSPTWNTAITATSLTASAGTTSAAVLTVTVSALNNTAFTASDLAIAVDTVEDGGSNANAITSGQTIADKQVPTLSTAVLKSSTSVELTFSENIQFDTNEATAITKITLKGGAPSAISITDTVATLTFGSTLGTVAITGDADDLEIATLAFKDQATSTNALALVADKDVTDSAGPEFSKAEAVSDTSIEITFTENVTVKGSPTWATAITADGITASAGTTSAAVLTVTVDSLNNTAFTASDLQIAVDTVEDGGSNANAVTSGQTIADKQIPTFTSAVANSNTNIELTFSEEVTVTTANGSDFTSGDFTATAAVIDGDATKVNLTVNSLGNTAFTSSDLDIAINAVEDISTDTNGIATTTNQTVSDGQVPTLTSATLKDLDHDGRIDAVDLVFSENIKDSTVDVSKWTIGGATPNATTTTVGGDAGADDEKFEIQYTTDDLAIDTSVTTAQVVFLTGDSITDANSNLLAAIANVSETDGAEPVPITVVSNRAIIGGHIPSGAVFTIDFSEDIISDNVSNFELGGTSEFVFRYNGTDAEDQTKFYAVDAGPADDPLESGEFSVSNGDLILTFSDDTNASTTWTTDAKFNTTANIVADELDDSSGNAAVANLADIAITGLTDDVNPTISAAQTNDSDNDGQIDQLIITFDEDVNIVDDNTGSDGLPCITLSNGYAIADGDYTNSDVTELTLTLTQSGSADTNATPDPTYATSAAGSIKDLSNNELGNGATVSTSDGAKPAFISATTADNDNNGQVDRLVLVFSENVTIVDGEAGDSLDSIGLSGGYSIANGDYATSGTDTITLTLTESGSSDTATTIDPTYTSGQTNTIKDGSSATNEMANNETVTGTDGAAPVLTSAASTNILQAGNIIDGKTITLNFSENVTSSAATFTLTVQRDGSESAQTYTQVAGNFDGATSSIANANNSSSLTITITGATTGASSTYTMEESQTQGHWTNGAQFKFTAIGSGTIKDGANNDINISGAYVSLAAEDGTAPDTVKVVGYDDGTGAGTINDGKLDKIKMYFNEALAAGTYAAADFTTLTAHDGSSAQALTISSVARDASTDNLVILTLDGAVNGTGAIVLTYTDNTTTTGEDIKDASAANNKYSNTAAKTPTTVDEVKPILLSVDINDTDVDGYLNNIVFTYSEDTTASSYNVGHWTITDNDGNTDLLTGASGSTSTNAFTITFADNSGTTAAPSYAYNGTSIKDGSDNTAAIASGSATDDVAPAMMTAIPTSQTTIDVTFSENLLNTTVMPSDFDIRGAIAIESENISIKTSGNTVTLTVPTFSWTDIYNSKVYLKSGEDVKDSLSNTLSGEKSVSVTTGSATIVSIAVTESTYTILEAGTYQFTATATYTDGSTADVTDSAAWVSSATSVATVGASTGLATGVSEGSTVITATKDTKSDTAVLTVDSAILSSIAVTPITADLSDLPIGSTQQFQAVGTYSDNTTRSITLEVVWASSDTATATIDASTGLATGVAVGSTNITCSLSGITSTPVAALDVIAKTVASIAVTPSSASIPGKNATQQFEAVATYTDNSTTSVTDSAAWVSSVTSVATVGASTGLATGVSEGSTVITATKDGKSGTANLTVSSATLSSIVISTSSSATVPMGSTEQLIATGVYSDNTTQVITSLVVWASSDITKATISVAGLTTGVAAGSTNITAAMSGVTSANFAITVTGASTAPGVATPAATTTVDANTYNIIGTAPVNAEVRAYTDNNDTGEPDDTSNFYLATADENGDYTVTVPLTQNVANDFVVAATESGKAISSYINVYTITEDSTPPVITILTPSFNGIEITDTTPTIEYVVTETNLSSTVVQVNGAVVSKVSGDSLGELSPGSHTLTIIATDAVGHEITLSRIFEINVSGVSLPTADNGSGIYNNTTSVILSAPGQAIYYTTDESAPYVTSSQFYSSAVSITGDTTLKAIAHDSGRNVTSSVATFYYIIKTGTDLTGPATHEIPIAADWNIFSVPKVVASSDMSSLDLGGETAYMLIDSAWVPYATAKTAFHSSVDFAPLYGYAVNNASSAQTLTITYETTVTDDNKRFERDFTTTGGTGSPGWYSVGVASPKKALTQACTSAVNVDTSDLIYRQMGSNITQIIDYTGNANSNSTAFAASSNDYVSRITVDDSGNIINVRETRGYIMYVNADNGGISGNQE